jgi:hypothetical protein
MINTDIKLKNTINIFSKIHEVICYVHSQPITKSNNLKVFESKLNN